MSAHKLEKDGIEKLLKIITTIWVITAFFAIGSLILVIGHNRSITYFVPYFMHLIIGFAVSYIWYYHKNNQVRKQIKDILS